MRLSDRKTEWVGLGLEVANVLQAVGTQTPEGHVEVDGQVHGYLRWYDDLTVTKGYNPLAEAIALGLQKKKFKREELDQVQALYAREWNAPASYVHGAIQDTIHTAFDCHSAFASLILGGVGRAVTPLRFVEASLEWLKEYRLVHHYLSGDAREAVWQKLLRPACDTPFISMEEEEIIMSFGQENALTALSEKFNHPTELIELLYVQAIGRAASLLDTVSTQPLKEPADDAAIGLTRIGFVLHMTGVTELRTAIRLARDNPELLEHIKQDLYSAVGGELNMDNSMVSYRIHGALRVVYKLCRQTGKYADFYKDSGLLEQPFSVKRFIATYLLYESQLNPTWGKNAAEA